MPRSTASEPLFTSSTVSRPLLSGISAISLSLYSARSRNRNRELVASVFSSRFAAAATPG